MNYRELLVGSLSAMAVCACSLTVSESSLASAANHDATSDVGGVMNGSFYVSGNYSPTFPSITSFDIRESGRDSSSVKSYSKTAPTLNISQPENFNQEGHTFKFAKNLLTSFEGAAGYAMGGARVEVEAGYKKFAATSDVDYKHADAHQFVGIGREPVFADGNYFVMKIDSITDISVMLNACYDVMHTDLPVSPYVCAGLGASFVDIANQTTSKLAYKGKVGVSYQLTPEISLIAGGFYHGLFDEKFENIPANNRVNFAGEALATVKANIASYGFNLGARFAFN
ncbi:major surface antigen 4 [Anaplasma platys]|uniref:Major surface antigen 4 n=1 Tax=Anaplasma platys TaxID=949 RepID=A0A858PZE0_9RICK|nr:P44/Msp2 family outer membrane protein [Anaplasma platys]QJC27908.1 major surface antigen 4 [Anaplasma platys]